MSQTKAELIKGLNINASAPATALNIDSTGRIGIGTSSPATLLEVRSATTNAARLRVTGTGTTAGNFRGYEFGNGSVFKGGLLQDESTDLISIFTPVGGQSVNITSAGSVGIGTTAPASSLHVRGTADWIFLADGTTYGNTIGIYAIATNTKLVACNNDRSAFTPLALDGSETRFLVSNTERARIDSSGRLLVGTSTNRNGGFADPAQVLIEGLSYNTAAQSIILNSNDGNGASLNFAKSRGTSLNSFTVVQSGDRLGVIDFAGTDGSTLRRGAVIEAFVDGTPGSADMPGRLVFSTTADGASSPTERLRVTSAGLVGIGTSAPGSRLTVSQPISNGGTLTDFYPGLIQIYNAQGLANSDTSIKFIHNFSSGDVNTGEIGTLKTDFYNSGSYAMFFRTGGTERMRITSAGDLSMADARQIFVFGNGDSPRGKIVAQNTSNNTTATVVEFRGWDASVTGTITTRINVTAYNTSSDYRLKENIADLVDATSRVKLLKPKRFNFKANPDETLDGFLAHEAQLAVPEAVSGQKDQVDDDNNLVPQGVDLGKFVPLLTAALQELIAEVESLKAEVATLKGA